MNGIPIGEALVNNAVDSEYNNLPNVDAKYGPYVSTVEALSTLAQSIRAIGLTVGIKTSNGIVEYWFKNGVADNNLVVKNTGGGGSGESYNIFTGNNIIEDTNVNLNSLFPQAVVKDVVIDTVLGGYYLMYQTGKWIKLNGTILTDTAPTVTTIRDVRMLSMK